MREIDWEHPPAELAEAALHAWRERLVKVLAGLDWRVERPYRAQALTRTDRRWSPRLITPAPKPVDIVAGDRVVVALPIPGRPYCLSRIGRAQLIFWSANRNWNNPARSNPEPQWMARVEFTSQHARSLGPRVSYTLPLANLQKVSEDGLLKGELSVHA